MPSISRARQFWVGRDDVLQTLPGCQDSFKMGASEVASFETNFLEIAGTLQAETSVSGKAEWLLAIDEDKQSMLLEWPAPLTKREGKES